MDWNQLKTDQIKAIEEYKLIAETDSSMRKFLVVLAERINQALHDLDTKENEEE